MKTRFLNLATFALALTTGLASFTANAGPGGDSGGGGKTATNPMTIAQIKAAIPLAVLATRAYFNKEEFMEATFKGRTLTSELILQNAVKKFKAREIGDVFDRVKIELNETGLCPSSDGPSEGGNSPARFTICISVPAFAAHNYDEELVPTKLVGLIAHEFDHLILNGGGEKIALGEQFFAERLTPKSHLETAMLFRRVNWSIDKLTAAVPTLRKPGNDICAVLASGFRKELRDVNRENLSDEDSMILGEMGRNVQLAASLRLENLLAACEPNGKHRAYRPPFMVDDDTKPGDIALSLGKSLKTGLAVHAIGDDEPFVVFAGSGPSLKYLGSSHIAIINEVRSLEFKTELERLAHDIETLNTLRPPKPVGDKPVTSN